MIDSEIISKELSLGEKETKLYLALLKMGTATPAEVAKQTGIGRTTTYSILDELTEKEFLQRSEEKRKKTYRTTPLPVIVNLVKQKNERKVSLIKNLYELIPTQTARTGDFEVQIISGIKEIRSFFMSVLEKDIVSRYIGAPQEIIEITGENFCSYWTRKRNELGIKTFAIQHKKSEIKSPHIRSLLNMDTDLYNVKFLESSQLVPNTIWLIEGKVVLFSRPEEKPKMVVIKSESLFFTFLYFFSVIWETL